MNIQDYLPALFGGGLIGLAAGLLLHLNGQVAGISGILNGAVDPGRSDRGWRWTFIGGLVLAGLIANITGSLRFTPHDSHPLWLLACAGLLVGAGTRIGNGCTSGHGVCGLARFSRRSLTATLTFMAAGFATVFLARHVLGGA